MIDTALKTELLKVAQALADVSRPETLRHFRTTGLDVNSKSETGFDPVTVADRAAETAMRDLIATMRPGDGILGEEFGPKDSETGLTWVLDPIDGTRGYISGTPTWGTLIALFDGRNPVLGVIDQPYIGERFLGGFGHALFEGPMGQRSLSVSNCEMLNEAKIFTTFPEVGSDAEGLAFHAVAKACKLTRYGMDCYAYGLLAAGQIDLVIEAGLQSYDIQAPIAVIEAAGGIVSDWYGNPAHAGGRVIAAATPKLHHQALSILAAHG